MKKAIEVGTKIRSLMVLGQRIRVQYTEMEEWGLCDNDQFLILLSSKCVDEPRQHWLTIIHEVTHMIFRMTGIAFMERNEEEAYVRCVENLIIPWILKHDYLRPE